MLFGSHLGWLLAAAGAIAETRGSWGVRLLGVTCLHLLAYAGARLMTRNARRRQTLASAHWADGLVPPLLLLPVPLDLAAIGFWSLPRTRERQNSLAAGAFEAQAPFKRLASFRQVLRAGGFASHFKEWNGDPFSRLAESRSRRERSWMEMHQVALFFQALAVFGALRGLGAFTDGQLLHLFWVLAAVSLAASCLRAILSISGWIHRASRWLSGLGRVAGVAFAIDLALAASPVWSQPAGAAFSWLAQVAAVAAALAILPLPLEILMAPERLRAWPASLLRAMAYLGLALLLAAAGWRRILPATAQIELLAVLAVASFFAPPVLLYLAENHEAPALARSRWLCLPFSALLLPLLHPIPKDGLPAAAGGPAARPVTTPCAATRSDRRGRSRG